MPLQIRPASEADGSRLGCIARDAFRDTLSRAIFPSHLHCKSETGDPGLDEAQWRTTRTLRRMREGKPTFVVVDVPEQDNSSEVLVGFAQWEPPSQPTSFDGAASTDPAQEMAKDPLPPSLDANKLQEMYDIIDCETKKALGPEGHSKMWYLMLLAVDPQQQRRGIGKMLVRHGLDLAAQAGTDAFVIATTEGRGMYQSQGFSQVGEAFEMGNRPHYSMLWRKPAMPVS
ncbi:hypothetical protein VTK26DRAFT_3279 [Humicola hyalothermophila]